jgi:beta-glucosidase
MAQLPFSVFQDRDLIREITLTGADTAWVPVSVELRLCYTSNFLLKIYFAQSGLELRNVRLVLAEDLEAQFREAQAARRAGEEGNGDPA